MRNAFTLVFAAFMTAASCPEIEAAPNLTKVVIAHASMNARTAILWIAQERGFFAKNGIEADLILMSRGPVLIASLTAGDVHFGYAGGTAALGAAAGGVEVKIVATFTSRFMNNLVVRPGIHNANDLRGKLYGVSSLGGTLWMGAMLWLEHLGLDPRRDNVRFLVIGDQTLLSQALEKGVIDVTALDSAFSRKMKHKGFSVLGDFSQVNLPIMSSGLVVKKDYVYENPATLEKVLKALLESQAFILAARNKPIVIDTLMKRLRISDPSLAEEGYQDMMAGFDHKPYPSLEGLSNIQRLAKTRDPRVAKVRVEDLTDSRFLRRLDQSGFIDQAYSYYGGK
ncbi:MAG: ABC transporter substrate-binding protein [Deltaproteobacteria bacterium]|nr:ABC transporter substrate-binding protein [Deltaproteobacteria bacterium]